MSRYCPRCGKEHIKNEEYCLDCHTRLPKDEIELNDKTPLSIFRNEKMENEKIQTEKKNTGLGKIFTYEKAQNIPKEVEQTRKIERTAKPKDTQKKTLNIFKRNTKEQKENIQKNNEKKTTRPKTNLKTEKPKTNTQIEKPKTKLKTEKPKTNTQIEKPKTKLKTEKPKTPDNAKIEKPKTKLKTEKPKTPDNAKIEKPKTKLKTKTPQNIKTEKPKTPDNAKIEKPKTSLKTETPQNIKTTRPKTNTQIEKPKTDLKTERKTNIIKTSPKTKEVKKEQSTNIDKNIKPKTDLKTERKTNIIKTSPKTKEVKTPQGNVKTKAKESKNFSISEEDKRKIIIGGLIVLAILILIIIAGVLTNPTLNNSETGHTNYNFTDFVVSIPNDYKKNNDTDYITEFSKDNVSVKFYTSNLKGTGYQGTSIESLQQATVNNIANNLNGTISYNDLVDLDNGYRGYNITYSSEGNVTRNIGFIKDNVEYDIIITTPGNNTEKLDNISSEIIPTLKIN